MGQASNWDGGRVEPSTGESGWAGAESATTTPGDDAGSRAGARATALEHSRAGSVAVEEAPGPVWARFWARFWALGLAEQAVVVVVGWHLRERGSRTVVWMPHSKCLPASCMWCGCLVS